MEISIDTSLPLNDREKAVLRLLLGDVPTTPEPDEETGFKPPAKKAPAKKPEPEPTPEPMAEEPLAEEPEDEPEDDDEQSDEELLALAVKKATEMVAGGEAAQVREALDAAGASRVRELNKDNVRDFFKALG